MKRSIVGLSTEMFKFNQYNQSNSSETKAYLNNMLKITIWLNFWYSLKI